MRMGMENMKKKFPYSFFRIIDIHLTDIILIPSLFFDPSMVNKTGSNWTIVKCNFNFFCISLDDKRVSYSLTKMKRLINNKNKQHVLNKFY